MLETTLHISLDADQLAELAAAISSLTQNNKKRIRALQRRVRLLEKEAEAQGQLIHDTAETVDQILSGE